MDSWAPIMHSLFFRMRFLSVVLAYVGKQIQFGQEYVQAGEALI
jgi:hypothetical protein